MPTYEYICGDCGYEFERFQSITAGALRKCPDCGKSTLKRLVGIGSGIIFKGSGFYQTDYRSQSYKDGEKSEKKAAETDKSTTKKETADKSKDSKSTDKTKPDPKGKKKSA